MFKMREGKMKNKILKDKEEWDDDIDNDEEYEEEF